MNPEEKQLLERAVSLSEENNKILRGIRRGNRFGLAWKIFYWIVIIAISYGAYVYIQPYVSQLMKTYGEVTGTVNKFSLPKGF
ncbi:MAG: hypothetical protein HYV67_04380 [Candidatus Taylorbacteria bacterium]|nr:hypothetical protein [Candidatus Taylorbacteria bacterium]